MSFYLLYVDESGDDGFARGAAGQLRSTPFFVKGGIIIDAREWRRAFIEFRDLYGQYSSKIGENIPEFKFHQIYSRKGVFRRLSTKDSRQLLYDLAAFIAEHAKGAIAIVVDKQKFIDNITVQKQASPSAYLRVLTFDRLGDSFQTWLFLKNKYGHEDAYGSIIHDVYSASNYIREREMENLINGQYDSRLRRSKVWDRIVDRTFYVDSQISFGVQLADVLCGIVYQHFTNSSNQTILPLYQRISHLFGTGVGRLNIVPKSKRKL